MLNKLGFLEFNKMFLVSLESDSVVLLISALSNGKNLIPPVFHCESVWFSVSVFQVVRYSYFEESKLYFQNKSYLQEDGKGKREIDET